MRKWCFSFLTSWSIFAAHVESLINLAIELVFKPLIFSHVYSFKFYMPLSLRQVLCIVIYYMCVLFKICNINCSLISKHEVMWNVMRKYIIFPFQIFYVTVQPSNVLEWNLMLSVQQITYHVKHSGGRVIICCIAVYQYFTHFSLV